MQQQATISNGITISIRKSNKAKRLSLRIKKGQPEVVIPYKMNIQYAVKFLDEKKTIAWLEERLAKQRELAFTHNSYIKIFGQDYKIIFSDAKTRGVELAENELIIYGSSQTSLRKIKRFLSNLLKEKVRYLVNIACKKLGVQYKEIKVKEMSSRLGSCSSKGNLNFCLRLIFTEYFILDYVVCHEVAHLREMNHSKNFWLLVESICPTWKEAKTWLKNNMLVILDPICKQGY